MADPRLEQLLEAVGGEVFVSADPGVVRMLSGHVADLETGPSPFALAPIVVASGEDEPILVAADVDGPGSYEGFTLGPLDPAAAALDALRRVLGSDTRRRVVHDAGTLSLALASALTGSAPVPEGVVARLTAVKTDDDVAGIRRSIEACDAGHRAARAATAAGVTELEVWNAARGAVEAAAGGRLPLSADLVSGTRTAEIGGPPGPRRLGSGELLLCDLVPRLDGFWGDSCATWAVDDAPLRADDLHAAATDALTAALDSLRPGVRAGDVDRAGREALASAGYECPHHIGHGVGFHQHEEPRIVPEGTMVLEPGMVVALEPGAYARGLGVRTEVVALITRDGHEVLSRHSLGLDRRGPEAQRQMEER